MATDYTHEAVLRKLQGAALVESEAMANDPNVRSSQRALDRAQKALESQPSSETHLAFDEAIQAFNQACNGYHRGEREAMIEAKKAEQRRAIEQEQAAKAAEQEAVWKQRYRVGFIGSDTAFEERWPELWKQVQLEQMQQGEAALKQHLLREVGYSGF